MLVQLVNVLECEFDSDNDDDYRDLNKMSADTDNRHDDFH